MNIALKQDLLSGEKFKRKDIIMLQDPQDLSNREIENFEHFRRAKELDQVGFCWMLLSLFSTTRLYAN